MEGIPTETICPSCHAPISADENFCPQCGKKLKEPPISTSIGKQIIIYLVSFFLAPFGLGYAIKYLKNPSPRAKKIGIVAIILTILAIAFMIWTASAFFSWEAQLINSF